MVVDTKALESLRGSNLTNDNALRGYLSLCLGVVPSRECLLVDSLVFQEYGDVYANKAELQQCFAEWQGKRKRTESIPFGKIPTANLPKWAVKAWLLEYHNLIDNNGWTLGSTWDAQEMLANLLGRSVSMGLLDKQSFCVEFVRTFSGHRKKNSEFETMVQHKDKDRSLKSMFQDAEKDGDSETVYRVPKENRCLLFHYTCFDKDGKKPSAPPVKPVFKYTKEKYFLTGCIMHVGKTLEDGHFYAYVHCGGDWYHCDDETVEK